jgi:multiple sugar transport system substrate-binding protein
MVMLRNFIVVALLFIGGIWLTRVFSGKHEAPNTIHLSSWGDIQENTILEGLINQFAKLHPDIHVVLDRVPYGDYVDKLLTQFAGGVAPDVIFVSAENLPDFYPRGLLEPLTSYLKSDPAVNLNDFYSTLIKWYTVNGDLYCMPRDIAPVCVLYYNKNAFDEVGLPYPKDDWSVDEFLKDVQVLTSRDAKGNTVRWGFADDWPLPEAWVYAFGGRFVDDPHHPTQYEINQPDFIKGVQFRADLINRYKVMPSPASLSQQGGVGTADMFERGKAALFLSGIWRTPLFRGIDKFKWDVVRTPRGKGKPLAVTGGSSAYGIVSTSKNKEAAWKLVAFLSGPDGQGQFARTGLIQPASKKIAQSPAFLDGKDPQNKKMLLTAVEYGIDEPIATNWREVKQGIIFPALDKVWMGSQTAAEAVAKLDEQLKKHPLVFQEKPKDLK